MTTIGPRRSAAAGLALIGLLAVGALASPPAGADDVSAVEAAAMARDAAGGDAAALERLEAVTEVDGRPVELAPVLDAGGADRVARLTDLAATWSADVDPTGDRTPAAAAASREQAAAVLDQERFREPDLPRPFRRPLRWLGERLGDGWDAAVSVLAPVLGTRGAALVLVAAMGAALVALLAMVVGRRSRGPAQVGGGARRGLVDLALDPADLEAQADRAAAAGHFAAAVRARYEAGLLRLVAGGRLALRPETTASDAARQVDHPAMDRLTAMFEEIVYGGRDATAADDRAARDGWADLDRRRPRRSGPRSAGSRR